MALCGLRVSELCKLRVEHLDLADRSLLVFQGKGKKDRYLPIPSSLAAELRAWVGDRRDGPVFGSPRGGHYTTRAVQKMIERARERAGISKRCTPHTLRHTYATSLLRSGANILEIKALMGHANIATTEIYTHLDTDQYRGAVDRLDEAA